ncbi:hypothetical protein GCT13_19165 [Paraburkholderia sp. CNPSo 3157]|uniref:Uncharacterized protein n=1 Tax=Paraburkholderia franconis TaxID=2654983 RepID=A0A7X1TGX3_9BURK|nr:hypothetical protein [Paraburkholderia franconis]MPW18960.1 hypothetical protein [Paraburkholderia franconis]
MRLWVKIVACFLIAWLPLLGYPAQMTLCPQMESMSSAQPNMHAAHVSEVTACGQVSNHHAVNTNASCNGSIGGVLCGMPAIPMTHKVMVVPSSPVYRAVARPFAEQFIPELPAPPPRSL